MEKVPKKKKRKGMKKSTVLLLILGAALCCCAGLFFLNRPVSVDDLPQTHPNAVLLERAAEEITALGISPREGEKYPLIRGENNAFFLLGQEDIPLRSDVIDEMLRALSGLEASHTVLDTLETPADIAHYGLSPALVEITVTYSDGEKKKLRIGDEAPTEETEYYCMLEGDSRIYTVLSAFCEPFFHEMAYMRDFEQPSLKASLLDRIDISGDITLGMYYTPSGWQMDAPYSYPVSVAQSEALLKRIEGMAFEACLGSAKDVDLAELGLQQPSLRIILAQAPTLISGENILGESVSWEEAEKKYTLLIGNETGKSGVYLMWEGMVYKASNFLLGFWKELNAEQLLLRTPVNFLTNNLNALTFRYENYQADYEILLVESIAENNEIATDEYGEILYEVAVKRKGNGEYLDAETFLKWYTDLAALNPAGKLPDGWKISQEEMKIGEIILQNDHLTRCISFYPYDALHLAMAVDGEAIYYIEKSWVDTVLTLP